MFRSELVQDPIDKDRQVQQRLQKAQTIADIASVILQALLGGYRHANRVGPDLMGLFSMSVECSIEIGSL